MKPIRSFMFVPGNREGWIDKCPASGADAVILDLEDSVPLAEKASARAGVAAAAATVAAQGLDVLVRINRPWRLAVRDLEDSVCAAVHSIAVPKVASADHIAFIAEILDEVLGVPARWAAGFLLNTDGLYGPSAATFGHSGWGGSFAMVDPDRKVALSYTMNRMGTDLVGDPRDVALIAAAYEGLTAAA